METFATVTGNIQISVASCADIREGIERLGSLFLMFKAFSRFLEEAGGFTDSRAINELFLCSVDEVADVARLLSYAIGVEPDSVFKSCS